MRQSQIKMALDYLSSVGVSVSVEEEAIFVVFCVYERREREVGDLCVRKRERGI